jgi:hypothetical protein
VVKNWQRTIRILVMIDVGSIGRVIIVRASIMNY